MNPIALAVEPLRADAIIRAEQEARKTIERVTADLAAHNGHINAAAPFADSLRMSPKQYHVARAKHSLYTRLSTTITNDYYKRIHIVRICPERCDKFIQDHKDAASAQYDLFIAKLTHRVGTHTAATLEGNHVWGKSILTVTTPTGTQRWKTQQIDNVSKLGKWFPQWPSRQLKR